MLNYFHPNSINKEEMNFILGIRNFEAVGDYAYELRNLDQIFERIEDYEFKQTEVLNYRLFDYMIENKNNTQKFKYLMRQLSNHSNKCIDFIKSYIERGSNIESFIEELCKVNFDLWFDLTGDNTVTELAKYKYLELILKHVNIDYLEDIVNNSADHGIVEEYENIIDFIESRLDILQKLHEIPIKKMKNIIIRFGLKFNIEIENVNSQLLEFIFDYNYYQLNENMLTNIFSLKCPEKIEMLSKANYKTICELGYEPLIERIHEDFERYVESLVMCSTNIEEDIDAVEEILQRLYSKNTQLCLKVIEKQYVIWEELKNCCNGCINDDESKKKVQEIWDYILELDRIKPTWANYITYHEQYGLTDALIKYTDKHMNELIVAHDIVDVTDNMVNKIMVLENLNLEPFKMLIKTFKVNEFTNTLNKFDGEKINALIKEKYFPLTVTRLIELREVFPDKCVEFIILNKVDFLEVCKECEVTIDEVTLLLSSDKFTNEEKIVILELIPSASVNSELALIIREFDFNVELQYVEAAWSQLEIDKRYQLLLNQITNYSLSDLEEKFKELDDVYYQLADRSKRRKAIFAKTEYNEKLMNKLKDLKYLTSVTIQDIEEENIHAQQDNKRQNIMCWVKQN